jgi:hypothetical protein
MKKHILLTALVAVSVLIGGALSVWSYVPLRWGAGGAIGSWRSGRFPLAFLWNEASAKGTPNLAAGSDPTAAVRAALASWQSVQTAEIRFADLQQTPLGSAVYRDGVNLITMADTSHNREILGGSEGAVALTQLDFNPQTGEIREADIILNPDLAFSTTLAPDTFDLQAILTHELGHALGSDHSSSQSDTMYSLVGPGEFFQRYLSADAVAFASFTYPSQARIASLGVITGSITSGGRGIFGASVTAVNLDRNQVYAAFSEPNGRFSINGPGAGRYAIYAEPLDGPATPDQLFVQGSNAYYSGLDTTFRTVFAGEFTLGLEGAPTRLDVDLSAPVSKAALNIDSMGRIDPESGVGYRSAGAVLVSPGETLSLFIGGSNTWKVSGLNDIRILGTGITLDGEGGIKIVKNTGGAQVGISVLAHIAPDAVPGARTLILKAGNEQVASTGGILVAAQNLPATTLYFPYLKVTPSHYTGIALANPTPDLPATVRISSRDAQGALLWSQDATVPVDLTIAGGTQSARLDRQIFNLPFNADLSGSATVESESPALQGFFVAGNFGISYLDGAEAFSRGYKQLYFTDVLQNANTATEIHLMNIRDIPERVDLALVGEGGQILRQKTRIIAAGGKIAASVAELFSYSGDLSAAHITATAADDALAGFGMIVQPDSIAGLNAQPKEAAGSVLYSPQLAVGDFGLHYDTRLNILNAGSSDTTATVAIFDANDGMLPDVKSIYLIPGAHFSLDVHTLFGLEQAQGYVRVTASAGGQLLGNVLFGDGDPTQAALNFAAALPLSASGTTDFLFAHLAQGNGYYTGVAVLAPPDLQGRAKITAAAFDCNGNPKGVVSFDLDPGRRYVALLYDLLAETAGQMGGYIRMTSDLPVVGFELFGTTDGRVLAAVPPQRLQK